MFATLLGTNVFTLHKQAIYLELFTPIDSVQLIRKQLIPLQFLPELQILVNSANPSICYSPLPFCLLLLLVGLLQSSDASIYYLFHHSLAVPLSGTLTTASCLFCQRDGAYHPNSIVGASLILHDLWHFIRHTCFWCKQTCYLSTTFCSHSQRAKVQVHKQLYCHHNFLQFIKPFSQTCSHNVLNTERFFKNKNIKCHNNN